jgi:hypothetical protein
MDPDGDVVGGDVPAGPHELPQEMRRVLVHLDGTDHPIADPEGPLLVLSREVPGPLELPELRLLEDIEGSAGLGHLEVPHVLEGLRHGEEREAELPLEVEGPMLDQPDAAVGEHRGLDSDLG